MGGETDPMEMALDTVYVKTALADVRAGAEVGAELVTQVLLADAVQVIEQRGEWLYGQVPDGYRGWLKKTFLVEAAFPQTCDLAMVTAPRAKLYREPSKKGVIVGEALMGADLPLLQEKEAWVKVWLPGREGAWLLRQKIEAWPGGRLGRQPKGEEIIGAAERLRDAPYLWGGVSLYGIDCSGLTYIVYYLNGIQLPRDADLQFAEGEPVSKTELQIGDLLFFNMEGMGALPTHVGIYKEKGLFINSRSGRGVIESSLKEPCFSGSYLGARRYLF